MKFYEHKAYVGYAGDLTDEERLKVLETQFNDQGFDDSVTWSLDHCLAKWLLPRLEKYVELAEKTIVISDEYRESLEVMIKGFKVAVRDIEADEVSSREDIAAAYKALSENYNRLWW